MKLAPVPVGARVVDTSKRVTPEAVAACVREGVAGIIRTVGHGPGFEGDNLDAAEVTIILSGGLRLLGVYGVYRKSDFSAANGTADAKRDVDQARAAGVDPKLFLSCDPEGNATAAEWCAYVAAYLAVVRGQFVRMLYGGIGFAEIVTTAQRDAFGADVLGWDARAFDDHPPSRGYVLRQLPTVYIGGEAFDDGLVLAAGLVWAEADDAPPATLHGHDAALFTFALAAGESVGDRRARCWEEALAAGPCGHTVRSDWYASFVNATQPAGTIGGQPVSSIASWATSCLITQEAVDNHCGRTPARVPRNGAGFFEVYDPAKMVRPGAGRLPSRGAVYYVANTGTDGHVVCILGRNTDGSWKVAGGGGGSDGTGCSIGTWKSDARGLPVDPNGRATQGWWEPEVLALPASPPLPSEQPTRPDQPNPLTLPPPAPTEKGEPIPTTPTPAKPTVVVPTSTPVARPEWPVGAILARVVTLLTTAVASGLEWVRDHPAALWTLLAVAVAVLLLIEIVRNRTRIRAWLRLGPAAA